MLASDSPMVRVWKPKPTGKATLTAPWNLRSSYENQKKLRLFRRSPPAHSFSPPDEERNSVRLPVLARVLS
jgi:hypothetical protein